MSNFEYKVVPAPLRGLKAKGVKGTSARFANALETVMNEFGTDGWEYLRTDTLPVEERRGLTGKTTTYQNMLVFRRATVERADLAPPLATVNEVQPQTSGLRAPAAAAAAPVQRPNTDDRPPVPPLRRPQPHDDTTGQAAKDRVSDSLSALFVAARNKRSEHDPTGDSEDR